MVKFIIINFWYEFSIVLILIVFILVDIWSVGCIFAELLGRKILFQAQSPIQQVSYGCIYLLCTSVLSHEKNLF